MDDWADVPSLRLGEDPKPEAEVRAIHTSAALYLAVTVPAMQSSDNEEAAFRDDLQLGLARRLSDTDFSADLIRLGFVSTGQTLEAIDRTPGHKLGAKVPEVKGLLKTTRGRTVYEIAIPTRLLRSLRLGEQGRAILNLSFPVPEEEAETEETAEPGLNSFSYLVRYGSDALVPVHFIELDLERGK